MKYHFLKILVTKEIVGRYKGSFLGLFWTIINPMLMILLYMLVFGYIFKARYGIENETVSSYGLVLYLGVMTYNLFAEIVLRSSDSILSNISYVKKILFPLEYLIVAVAFSSLVHFLINFSIWLFIAMLLDLKIYFSMNVLFLVGCLITFSTGVGWFVASLSVYLRDIHHVLPTIMNGLMFISPIFYSSDMISGRIKALFEYNPIGICIELIRKSMIFDVELAIKEIIVLIIVSGLAFFGGYLWFMRTKKGFADVV